MVTVLPTTTFGATVSVLILRHFLMYFAAPRPFDFSFFERRAKVREGK